MRMSDWSSDVCSSDLHEIVYATANGLLGSFDINRGDPQNGWDTDQFPNDAAEAALALYHVMNAGGFTTGGFNFDAKIRRQSIDPVALFHAPVGGIDRTSVGEGTSVSVRVDPGGGRIINKKNNEKKK